MNNTQLRYVKAVALTGSFTKAAEECFVTQPTLSNGIAQLEQEFEQPLFTRTTRKVTLTPFGESILPFIDATLDAEKHLLRHVRSYERPEQATLRVGVSPLTSSSWLRKFINKFRQENTGADIMLHEQNMADLYRMLAEELLDFVFGVAGVSKSNWESQALYEEPLLYIPKGYEGEDERRPKSVMVDEVADETFVMVPNSCGLAQATRSLFRRQRRKLKEYSGEALSYQVLEEWAGLGLGAAILPSSKLSGAGNTAIALTDKNGQPILIKFEAVWIRKNSRPAMLQKFIEHINNYQSKSLSK